MARPKACYLRGVRREAGNGGTPQQRRSAQIGLCWGRAPGPQPMGDSMPQDSCSEGSTAVCTALADTSGAEEHQRSPPSSDLASQTPASPTHVPRRAQQDAPPTQHISKPHPTDASIHLPPDKGTYRSSLPSRRHPPTCTATHHRVQPLDDVCTETSSPRSHGVGEKRQGVGWEHGPMSSIRTRGRMMRSLASYTRPASGDAPWEHPDRVTSRRLPVDVAPRLPLPGSAGSRSPLPELPPNTKKGPPEDGPCLRRFRRDDRI